MSDPVPDITPPEKLTAKHKTSDFDSASLPHRLTGYASDQAVLCNFQPNDSPKC